MRLLWNWVIVWLLWPLWWPLAVLFAWQMMGREISAQMPKGNIWWHARAMVHVCLGWRDTK
jgi:hypothetical protein